MSETPIADMVEKMLSADMSYDMVVLAVRTVELVWHQPIETTDERRRARDREYRRDKRRHGQNAPSSLSSSSSFFPLREKKEEEEKKVEKASARCPPIGNRAPPISRRRRSFSTTSHPDIGYGPAPTRAQYGT
jgi:hypothetical protein